MLITFTSYFGAVPMPMLTPISILIISSASIGMPVITALAYAFTVPDVWREWTEGLAGQPAVRELEEKWGSRWRLSNTVRVQFCRRKVIWDEVLARTAHGARQERGGGHRGARALTRWTQLKPACR